MYVTKWRLVGHKKNRLAKWDGCGLAGISVVWFNEYVSRWSAMGKTTKKQRKQHIRTPEEP